MPSLDLDPLVLALAEEFRQRGMTGHLDLLRTWYRGFRARKRAAAREKHQPWTEEMVLEWLAIFRVSPFDGVYPALARGVPCPECKVSTTAQNQPYVACVFPGGAVRECRGCGARWLELDEAEL